ncbi:unnamed protein product [Rhizoctonia solani]|uniref:Uncharacterized protein n=1 Tax=Rhizoctonia solani TaxID=456999 RepID=A0A8H2WYV6_9AGAM|nr:unnamed protein product [Rhizoctonia solani]
MTTMTLPDAIQTRLSGLEKRLSECELKLNRLGKAKKHEERDKVRNEEFIGVFKDTCALVREAELADAPYLMELAKLADKILDDGVGYSYGRKTNMAESNKGVYDFMPSWAHEDGDRPLIKDEDGGKFPLPHGGVESLLRILKPPLGENDPDFSPFKIEPWSKSSKRHPKSTDLARFRPDLPVLTPILDNPIAASVLDARCDISSSRCAAPIRFLMNSGNKCLALTGMGGFKNRSPALQYLFLDQPLAPSTGSLDLRWYEPGLSGVAFHGAIDESRRLIFVGDDDRIKSYEWGSPEDIYKEPLPVHTLRTQSSRGPMTILPNGLLVRAGKGGASVFDTNTLPTHGPDGTDTIGELMDTANLDITRDDEIEPSSGSAATSHIKFLDQPNLKPNVWQPLPTTPSTVLCAEYAREAGKYSCVGIDLETGRSTAYYLGHGADVSAFSVSSDSPQLFMTACNDGFARLFDLRRPLPVVTLDSTGQSEFCESVALAHPDGIPIVFTGTHKREQIKVWDVRARACVYELATGNNAVQSLAWDAQNHCLYAATECEYMDRHGYRRGYRRAKIPKGQRFGIMGGDGKIEYYEDEDDGRCWPEAAWHREDYFGYLFDAGDHRIFRYAFKEDPKSSAVPEYGDASVNESYW